MFTVRYSDIYRFVNENSEKWKTSDVDDIRIGLLVSEDGRARKIQIDAMELSPEEAKYFLDCIFSSFKGQGDKLTSIYDRIEDASKPLSESPEWRPVFRHIDEDRQKSRIIASVNDVMRTKVQDVKEGGREGLQRIALEVNKSDASLYSMQSNYERFIYRLIDDTEGWEQKLKVYPLVTDLLLEESRKSGYLATSGKEEWNALHFAACNGDASVIEKAKEVVGESLPSALNQGKDLPLYTAIYHKQYEFAAALGNAGADINARNDVFQPILNTLIRNGKSEQIEFCLHQEGIDLNIKDQYDHTILHLAVMTGNASIVELLLRNEAVAAQKQEIDFFGRTPLDIALQRKADDVIKLLLGDPTIDVEMLPGYDVKPQRVNQGIVLGKLRQYLSLQREQDVRKLSSERDQLTPEDFARRRREIRDPSVLPQRGHCAGFSLLLQYYVFRGKEDEFYSAMQLFSEWDGTEESLQSTEAVRGLSGNYTNLQDLIDQWINDIVWFQQLSNIDLPFSQSDRVSQFETVRKYEEDNFIQVEQTSYHFTEEQLAEWLTIQSHFPGNVVEWGGSEHSSTATILPDGKALYYDSNVPYRVPPFASMDRLASMIKKTKHLGLGKTRNIMHETIHVYRMVTGDQREDSDDSRTVPPEFLEGTSPNGYSKLHFAILFNDRDLFNAHLAEEVDSVNVADAHSQTPLFLAIVHGREDMVEKLLGLGNVDFSYGTNRVDLLSLAIARGHENIARLLMERGLETNGEQVYLAVQKGQKDVLRMLVAKGIDIAEINYASEKTLERPLHIAVKRQDREMVEILLRNGADPKAKAREIGSVLACIADIGEPEFLKLVVPLLPDLNETDEDGFNLLHHATCKGNVPLVTVLLENGADVTIRDKNGGMTAADIANSNRQNAILTLLSPTVDESSA